MKFPPPLRALALAAILGGSAAMTGCDLLPSASNAKIEVPAIGTPMTAELWESYMPKYKAGMVITYVSVSTHGDTIDEPVEATKEYLKVEDSVISYRSTIGSTSVEATMSAITKPESNLNLKSEGPEDVTVPAGTFKGAAKFSGPNGGIGSTITYWLVPGKGYVKVFTSNATNGTTASWTNELKVFKE